MERALPVHVCLLEAPGGYGKTTLAEDLATASELARIDVLLEGASGSDAVLAAVVEALRHSGLTDLADAAARATTAAAIHELAAGLTMRGEPLCVVVDEVQRLTLDGADWLAELVAHLADSCRFVLAGRQIPAALRHLGARPDALHLGADDLRFSPTEIAELVGLAASEGAGDPKLRGCATLEADILRRSGGWPAAVSLMVGQRLPGRADRGLGPRPLDEVMADLVDGLLDGCPEEARARLQRLATVPLLSQDVAAALSGGGALEDAVALGLPLVRRPDGWLRLPDPVRDALAPEPLDAPRRRAVARAYAAAGELHAAVHLLHDAGDVDGLAEVLGGCPWAQLEAAGVSFARVVAALLGDDELARHPDVLVLLARAVEHGDRSLRRRFLELADRATAGSDGEARRMVLAELARDASRSGDFEQGEQLAHLALHGATRTEIVTRGRALYAWGMADTLRCTSTALARAADTLGEAATLHELAGEYRWSSEALLRVGYAVSFHGGAVDAALEQVERALALLGAADISRAVALTYFMDVLDHAARSEEAEAAGLEALAIGHRLGDQTAIGFACWGLALVTAHRGDHPATLEWLADAERHGGRWIEEAIGTEFALAACDMLALLGDEPGARRYMAQGIELASRHGLHDAPVPAIGRVEAMFGDPERAEAILAELDGRPFAVPRYRWARALLRAFAAHRRADTDSARALLRRAEDDAARCGYRDLPARHERWIHDRLAPYRGEQPRAALSSGTRVTLLGRFAVSRGGEDISPPPGNPATLVKLLALRGSMTAEEVIDRVWPDADLATGRARLRNTLNRLRVRCGDLVDRRGDELGLATEVVTDVAEFEAAVAVALAAPPHERAGLARRAAALHGGELLPADRYEDWVAAPRERLRRRFVAVTDALAADAEARGDYDEAVRQLDVAVALEPLDEARYVQAARLLVTQGRRAGARDMVRRALAALHDLGIMPGPALLALADDVGSPLDASSTSAPAR